MYGHDRWWGKDVGACEGCDKEQGVGQITATGGCMKVEM